MYVVFCLNFEELKMTDSDLSRPMILIIEDDPETLNLNKINLKMVLKLDDDQILVATDAEAAKTLLTENKDRIRLIVSDGQFPQLATRSIREDESLFAGLNSFLQPLLEPQFQERLTNGSLGLIVFSGVQKSKITQFFTRIPKWQYVEKPDSRLLRGQAQTTWQEAIRMPGEFAQSDRMHGTRIE